MRRSSALLGLALLHTATSVPEDGPSAPQYSTYPPRHQEPQAEWSKEDVEYIESRVPEDWPSAPTYDTYPPRHLEPQADPTTWSTADVESFIESTGFFEYKRAFAEKGIDGPKLLRLTAERLETELVLASAEHNTMLEAEITELRLRRGLLRGAERRAYEAAHPPVQRWDGAQVRAFLVQAGLGEYASHFATAGVNGPRLLELTEAEVRGLCSNEPPGRYEEDDAAAELFLAAQGHLRWQIKMLAGGKDEL
jgi:hypothetical protein